MGEGMDKIQKGIVRGAVDLVVGGPVLGIADWTVYQYKEATGGDTGVVGGALKDKDKDKNKKENPIAKQMNDLKIAAQQIIDYYNMFGKDGIVGAGDFMQAAAAWNYDPDKRRPHQAGRI